MSGFFKFHRWVVTDTDLMQDHAALATYCHLARYARYYPKKSSVGTIKAGECDSSREQIAMSTGLSKKKVGIALSRLIVMGAITERVVGGKSVYKIEARG